MPDIIRSLAAVLGLIPDNVVGNISPQDMRDQTVSLVADCGELFVSTPAATTFVAPSTFGKVAGTTTLINSAVNAVYADPRNVDSPASWQLRYTNAQAGGGPPRRCSIQAEVSLDAASANKTFAFRLAVNGTALVESEERRRMSSNDVGHISVHLVCVLLSDGDTVELHVANLTDTTSVTISNGTLSIKGDIA